MAFASSLHSEVQFQCSICTDVFTDPITTPCGHNYCNACITQHWDTTDVCKCPLCQETFYIRPKISVNKVLSELADQFRKSNEHKIPAKPDEVSCDVCDGTKRKAVKTCLVCLASYCETHLEPHLKATAFKRHRLTDPVESLGDVMCMKHDRPLELFCKTDDMCVCQFCTQSDHRSHRIVSLKEEYDVKKAELGKTEAEVQKMIRERRLKIQEVKRTVELSKKDADREIADSVQVFTALTRCIERSQAEVIDRIEEKQKTTEKQAEGFINELQQEITQLEKRSSELKKISLTEDHLQLLQKVTSITTPPPIKDWTEVQVQQPSYAGTVSTAVAELEKTLIVEIKKQYVVDVTLDPDTALPWLILSEDGKQVSVGNVKKNLPDNAERFSCCVCVLGRQSFSSVVDVTLDPDTALPWLILSEDGKQVSLGDVKKNLPDNAERFSFCVCVLGRQSFSSGRFYYEVQVKRKTEWDVGVARESINRKGPILLSPKNGYWTIRLRNENKYEANADPPALLPVREKLQIVGVFVDYEEGLVSFYDVETRVHLFSFTGCCFVERLYPFFSPCLYDDGENSAPLIISPINRSD